MPHVGDGTFTTLDIVAPTTSTPLVNGVPPIADSEGGTSADLADTQAMRDQVNRLINALRASGLIRSQIIYIP